jgi:putative NIF3 family GTP cyclohydrolase 1 type 2
MSALLTDVIGVLEAAYPPALAAEWDSVGLVCGDPDERVDSVTIAVDATSAVVAETPEQGLLLSHHPLLLRGVDTVAADTAKGAIVHRLIRRRSALFTAHTNADCAAPGVSDALAEALGLVVEGVLSPVSQGAQLDKWVVFVPAPHANLVREAMFDAGAGRIGDYSHCSWTVAGQGRFLPLDGASPAIGTVGSIEHVAEDRIELIAPAGLRRPRRDAGGPSLRGARVRRVCPRSLAVRRRHRSHLLATGSREPAGLRLSGRQRAARDVVGRAGRW